MSRFKRLFRDSSKEMESSDLLQKGERDRLQSLSRFTFTETYLLGKKFQIIDAGTFLSSLDEIFKEHIYKFKTCDNDIIIIDCGANIGLSTIYFKINFPHAKIIAFEADPNIFKVMEENLKNQGFFDVLVRNEAVSFKDGTVNFFLEGGHSGMIVDDDISNNLIKVKSSRLKDVLTQFETITFLKIDIEGHERFVLPDIINELRKVKFLFLEYHSFIETSQDLDKVLSIISKAGFRYYIRESTSKQLPFEGKELFYGMDMLVNIFCYRTQN